MSTPAAYLSHGQPSFLLEGTEFSARARQIDIENATYRAETTTAYDVGDAWPTNEYLRIVELSRRRDGSGYLYRMRGEGIANGSTWKELNRQNQSPEVGWDVCALEIYTRDLTESRWAKGQRLKEDALTSISATASTDTFTKTAHGLVTGQCLESFTFGSGFGGLTSGSNYFVIKLTADTFKLATTRANADAGTAINISSDGTGASATPLTFGHELMFITGKQDRPADAQDYHHLDLEIKGLLMRSGDSKPVVRQWQTASGKYSTRLDGLATLTAQPYAGFPPAAVGSPVTKLSGTDLAVEYAIPNPRVTDTMVTTQAPDPNWLYRFWEPDNAPSVSLFTLSAAFETYQFPWGWKLVDMQVQQISGQSVWLLSLTWEYIFPATPKSA